MCAFVCDCADVNAGACRGQKRALDSLRLALQVVVSCLMWMGTTLKSAGKPCALNLEPSLPPAHF